MGSVGGIKPIAKPAMYSLSSIRAENDGSSNVYPISYTCVFTRTFEHYTRAFETSGAFSHETNFKYANYCCSRDEPREPMSTGAPAAADAEVKIETATLYTTSRRSSATNIRAILNRMRLVRNQFCSSPIVT